MLPWRKSAFAAVAQIGLLAQKREIIVNFKLAAKLYFGVVKIIYLRIQSETVCYVVAKPHAELALHAAHAYIGGVKLLAKL